MQYAPKVGQRVKLKPDHRYYPCSGVVTRIAPKHEAVFDDDGEFIQHTGKMAPENKWQVFMKTDHKPKHWAYGDNDTFCPEVDEIEPE